MTLLALPARLKRHNGYPLALIVLAGFLLVGWNDHISRPAANILTFGDQPPFTRLIGGTDGFYVFDNVFVKNQVIRE
jgi:hypothetical protein